MALRMTNPIGAQQLGRTRLSLRTGGLPTRLAAVGVHNSSRRISQSSRIAQLARAAAQDVEVETFDVSRGCGRVWR